MEKYKLKEDIVWGLLENGEPNIIFKKGDVIQGIEIEKFVQLILYCRDEINLPVTSWKTYVCILKVLKDQIKFVFSLH